ncbi:unnamed protein product [Chondrus crispus]|uniref:B-related factor 1 n=1 Tax=Chondrus crispus TaxID=2769 RepID=R7QQ93_CHOCR|nr:unnamed protein product [Chondrus crispus]CDF39535.1 unnamed protein product [Chondrus crispus]|eukprot:XP_005713447.1 unnamed protein product [Chondrus crispus]
MSTSALKCPNCDSYDIDTDTARGEATCVECGTVLEQNLIVSEVGFSEDARGRSNVIGQHVRADGRLSSYGALRGFSREATELTMQNGKRRLGHLASSLGLNTQKYTEGALRLFRVAVERNFHKGRRMANVCCACLYIVCRMERTAHMLLDFADVLETNLYDLGHTFLKLGKILSIQLPIIDPSLYIHRFANKLEFGEVTNAVAMSALRLIARMQRDWMNEGRRPSGLCGAALLIAARMHDFYRSQADVTRVVRIGNVALRDRLTELHNTSTATLTAAQIDAGGGDDGKWTSLNISDGSEACDPPAFQRLEARRALLAKRKRTNDADSETAEDESCSTAGGGSVKKVRITPGKGGRTTEDEQLEGEFAKVLASSELQELEQETNVEEELVLAAQKRRAAEKETDLEGDSEDEEDDEIEKEADDGELSDLDEEDAEKYLNTEEEYERKKELWTEVNKEYLEKQEKLERMKRENPEEYKRLRPWRNTQKKKKTARSGKTSRGTEKDDEEPQPVAPKPSKKLNYSVLKTLGEPGGAGLLGSVQPVPASGALPPLAPRADT